MFQPDANEIIEDMSQQIAGLFKANAILKSQLKAAEAHIQGQQAQQKEPIEGVVVDGEAKKKVA